MLLDVESLGFPQQNAGPRRAPRNSLRYRKATADSDGDEPPAVEEVQFVTVVDSPPRPPSALLSHINCAICMDAVGAKELASTVCGHVFCWSCIQESLKARKKCPTCRKALRATQVHRLYV